MAARRSSKKRSIKKTSETAVARRGGGSAIGTVSTVAASWQDRIKQHVERDAATAGGIAGWPYIGTSGGIFTLGEDDHRDKLEDVIILGAMHENAYYEGDYVAGESSAPVCFALSETEDDLAPPESLGEARQILHSEPVGEKCVDCWANQFGTAERGKGKACKNVRRLALLPADKLTVPYLSKVEGAMLRLPVTSVKGYSTFVNKVTKVLGVPLFMLRCAITIEKDATTQFKIDFEPQDWVTNDKGQEVPGIINDEAILEVLLDRVNEAEAYLKRVPSAGGDEESGPKRKGGRAVPAKAGGRAKPSRRKAGTRTAGKKAAGKKADGRKF